VNIWKDLKERKKTVARSEKKIEEKEKQTWIIDLHQLIWRFHV
jgi:hypothetical protein